MIKGPSGLNPRNCNFTIWTGRASRGRETARQQTPSIKSHSYRIVTIKTGDTLNPDLDIAPQGGYVIRAHPRPSPLPESQADHPVSPQSTQLLVAYGSDGKAVGLITSDRLLVLYRSYEQASTTKLSEDTSHDAFHHAAAVASLMHRYRERQTDRGLSGPDEQLLDDTRIPHDSHQTRILCCNREICLPPEL